MLSKLTELPKKVFLTSMLAGVFVVTLGSFLGSFFSYLLQVFLGRKLSLEDYGTFNTLLSFSTILGVLAGAFSNSVVKKVSALKAEHKFDTLTHLFWNLSFYCLLLGVLLSLFLIASRRAFSEFLNIPDWGVLISFAFLMGLTFVGSLPRAYLQGLLRFKALAFWIVFTSLTRLIFPLGALYGGFGLSGVFGGMSLGTIISFILAIFLLLKNFEKHNHLEILSSHYKNIVNFVGPLIFIQVGLTLLNNADVILVKKLFSPELAGTYAGVVTVGKILLFGAGSVGTIMFPIVAEKFASGEDSTPILKKFLSIQALLVVVGSLPFIFFPKFITTLMFGSRFLQAVEYVPMFTVFMGAYVLVNFFILYFMAVERYEVIYILGLGVILQIVLIWVLASTLQTVILINSVVVGLVLFGLIVFLLFRKEK